MNELLMYCEDPRHPCNYDKQYQPYRSVTPTTTNKSVPRRDFRTPDLYQNMGNTDAMKQLLFHSNNPPQTKQQEPANRMRTTAPQINAVAAEAPYYHPRRFEGRNLTELQFPDTEQKLNN